ncbi:MAG TPA: substrate-binding domain-containing protein [Acetobacteraceae bacterium]|nr:substrate-binding domain-containing protein [Acetobacteraceae bacterium]
MDRRSTLKLFGAAAAAGAMGLPGGAFAAGEKQMVTVVKIAGIPWFNLLEKGLIKAGSQFGIKTSMVGPANVDPAQQVKLVEDLIAKKVDVIGLVPLDVKVLAPVVERAHKAGIMVITQEGPNQSGRTWDVELINSTTFGEMQMKALAKAMGEKGEYVVYVGTLTTPLHNKWADAAIAYQKKHYPNMKLAASRFPGADEIDTSARNTQDVIQAYPKLGGIIGFGSNGPIGAGNVVRQRHLQNRIAVVGTVLPSQGKSLIESGVIREGFIWSPTDAGFAMVAVASLALKKAAFATGMDVPGLGKATVDAPAREIMVNRILVVNKQTINGLIAKGL